MVLHYFLAFIPPCFFNKEKKEQGSNWHSGIAYNLCCWYCLSCLTLCDPMDCSMPGFPVLHYLWEFAQTYVQWFDDTIQPSHPLSSPSLALKQLMVQSRSTTWPLRKDRRAAETAEIHKHTLPGSLDTRLWASVDASLEIYLCNKLLVKACHVPGIVPVPGRYRGKNASSISSELILTALS